ncbi:MAG: hypothetical protein M3Y27_02115 [Acidobacteriota bacterium]|nr:hypothetical protein [Acidobacteriota bacterium]
MTEIQFHNRRAVQLENDRVRLTVTVEGGHVAEILHKPSGVNPLWIPPWPSIEPSTYSLAKHPEYGDNAESKLLAGIMGHNLCLDLFGAPSDEEARAGISVHGEASVVPYQVSVQGSELIARCIMPIAQIAFERRIRLTPNRILFSETVENLSALDRPIAWTQHVTLGPPFMEYGVTEFRAPVAKSHTLNEGFSTHLMDPHNERAYFFALSPRTSVMVGYVWKRSDFPWLGIWEEKKGREHAPWNRRTVTRGMEFGASPLPESRRQMIDRNSLFGVPAYRWLPAKSKLRADYYAFITTAKSIPESLEELEIHVPA